MFETAAQREQLDQLMNTSNHSEVQQLISQLIDAKINECKIQFIKAWEADHSVCSKQCDQEVAALKQQKQNLLNSLIPSQSAKEMREKLNTQESLYGSINTAASVQSLSL